MSPLRSLSKIFVLTTAMQSMVAVAAPEPPLKVVILRHAEKPDDGANLSCRGLNRSLARPAILWNRYGRPDLVLVPTLKQGNETRHARMFQTIVPMAVRLNLEINTSFEEDDVTGMANHVLGQSGTVLIVWQHSQIPALTKALGVGDVPEWKDKDFDSIWVVTRHDGTSRLSTAVEGLDPSPDCPS